MHVSKKLNKIYAVLLDNYLWNIQHNIEIIFIRYEIRRDRNAVNNKTYETVNSINTEYEGRAQSVSNDGVLRGLDLRRVNVRH